VSTTATGIATEIFPGTGIEIQGHQVLETEILALQALEKGMVG
jgi:hypothetical protein